MADSPHHASDTDLWRRISNFVSPIGHGKDGQQPASTHSSPPSPSAPSSPASSSAPSAPASPGAPEAPRPRLRSALEVDKEGNAAAFACGEPGCSGCAMGLTARGPNYFADGAKVTAARARGELLSSQNSCLLLHYDVMADHIRVLRAAFFSYYIMFHATNLDQGSPRTWTPCGGGSSTRRGLVSCGHAFV